MIVAGTGHRPDKLGGYDESIRQELIGFAQHVIGLLRPRVVISGMALGWDQALAHAALERRVELWAYVPFEGQESRWPRRAQREYHGILRAAAKTKIISAGGYSPEAMHARNAAMVEDADKMLALYDGKRGGGTFDCLLLARDLGVPVHHLWQSWQSWQSGELLI